MSIEDAGYDETDDTIVWAIRNGRSDKQDVEVLTGQQLS